MADIYGFGEDDAKRIGRTVRRVERDPVYSNIPGVGHISRRIAPGAASGTSGYMRNFILVGRKLTTDGVIELRWADDTATLGTEQGTAYDPFGQFSAFGSATGLAGEVFDTSTQGIQWQIVALKMPANFVVANLNDALPRTYGTYATVSRYFGDAWNDEDPGNTVFVYNGIHTLLANNQLVLAVKNNPDTDPVTYEVIEVLTGTGGGAAMTAKLTESVDGMNGICYGSLGSVAIGMPVNGCWQQVTVGTVYSPSKLVLHVYDEVYAPVYDQNNHWVLNPTEISQVDNWTPSAEMHLVQCIDGLPHWAGKAPIIDLSPTDGEGTCGLAWDTACGTGALTLLCSGDEGNLDCESYGTGEFVTSISCDGTNMTYETIVIRLPCGVEGT